MISDGHKERGGHKEVLLTCHDDCKCGVNISDEYLMHEHSLYSDQLLVSQDGNTNLSKYMCMLKLKLYTIYYPKLLFRVRVRVRRP